jgi:hypothetical protein
MITEVATSTSDSITIRPATGLDCPVLTAMVRQSAAYDGDYRVMVADQTIDQRYLLANPVWVAVDRQRVVGFYSLLLPGRGRAGEGELDFMFVADRDQRRGVGRLLFDDLRLVAASLRLSRVHIVSHPPSEGFYLAQGARRIGQVPPAGRAGWARPHLVLEIGSD